MRRFKVVVSTSVNIQMENQVVGISENMFVHNNSKHGRRSKRMPTLLPNGLSTLSPGSPELPAGIPKILAISPNEGNLFGNEVVTIIGEHFEPGLRVIFGGVVLYAEYICSSAMSLRTPPKQTPGTVEVTFQYTGMSNRLKKCPKLSLVNTVLFNYSMETQVTFTSLTDYNYQRLKAVLYKMLLELSIKF